MLRERKRYPLDTAAKLFPPVSRPTNTSVFRLSVVLTEEVRPEALQKAAEETLRRYPYMAVRLRKNGLEETGRPFSVMQEEKTPCALFEPEKEEFLLRVLWYKRRISVEIFHALADGTGGVMFLKTLLHCYFRTLGCTIDPEGKILLPDETPQEEEYEDSFLRYYDGTKTAVHKLPPAFKIKGEPLPDGGRNVIHGVFRLDGLKRAAKRQGATVTEYLCALMAFAIYRECVNDLDDEPIVLSVPVNLRAVFPSCTVRNFFSIVNITVSAEQAGSLRAALDAVRRELRENTRPEKLREALRESCGAMEHPVVRAVPQFMRDAGLRFVFAFFSEDVKTMTISNVGAFDLPKGMLPYIDHAESVVYPTERSPINCCLCSAGGKMTVSFIRTVRETGPIRFFFRFLARETGEEISVYTNDWGILNGKV